MTAKKVWLPDRQTDRHRTKCSLCAAMLRRRHKNHHHYYLLTVWSDNENQFPWVRLSRRSYEHNNLKWTHKLTHVYCKKKRKRRLICRRNGHKVEEEIQTDLLNNLDIWTDVYNIFYTYNITISVKWIYRLPYRREWAYKMKGKHTNWLKE